MPRDPKGDYFCDQCGFTGPADPQMTGEHWVVTCPDCGAVLDED